MARIEDVFLTKILLDIINKRDFIDYGILMSNTTVLFDEDNFDIVVISPYYFNFVKRNGASLLDDFIGDPKLQEFITYTYEKIIQKQFQRILSGGSVNPLDFIPPQPEIVFVPTMNYSEVQSIRSGLHSRRAENGRSSRF